MATKTALRVQVDLQAGDRVRTCWVEPRVHPGMRITLKNSRDPGTWWTVLNVYRPVDVGSINQGWENDI